MTKTNVNGTRTRSGRISKVPERLDPVEHIPEDDYSDEDYETESDIDSDDEDLLETDDEDDFEDDDEDMDENGNLKGFIVDDDEDEDE